MGESERGGRRQVLRFLIMVKGQLRAEWCCWEIAVIHCVNNLVERIMKMNVCFYVVCLFRRLGFKDSKSPH